MTTHRAAYSILIICLVSWLAAQPGLVWAQGPVVLTNDQGQYPLGLHLAILEDSTQQLTLDQITSPAWADQFMPSQTETPNFGYTHSAIWARAQINNESTTADWRLEINDPTLDSIDLYLAPLNHAGAPAGPFTAKRSGDRLPFAVREVDQANFVFKLPLPLQATYVMYLRVVNRGSTPLEATIWLPEALARHNESTHLMLGFFYGFIFIMACYNLFLFFFLRDRAYLYYVLCMVGLGFYSLSLDGLARQYLWPHQIWWGDVAILEGISLALWAGAGFSRNFLNLKRYSPWLDKVTLGLAVVAAGLLAAGLWPAAYPWVSQSMALLTLAAVVIGLAAGLAVWRQGYYPARYYLLAWVGLLVGAALVVLGQYALLPLTFLTVYGLRFGVFLLVLLLSLALADRINLLRAETDRANTRLREGEQRITQFLEAMPVGAVVMDRQSRLFYVNQQARNILQLSDQILSGQVALPQVLARFSFYMAGTEQLYPLADLPFSQALQGHSVNIDNLEIALPSGRIPLEVWASPIFDEQGRVNYAIIAFSDITGRQEIADELKRYRLRLEEMVARRTDELALVNAQLQQDINRRQQVETELRKLSRAVTQSASTIVITDLSGAIEFVNPAFTRITGYSPAEAIGQNPRVLKSGKMPQETYQDLWATISRGDTWQGELLNRKKNGEFYWEYATISPVKDKDGQTTHYVAVKEDITARKRAEALLQESNQKSQTTNARLAVIQEIGKIITAQLHLDTMLEILTQSTTKLFGADAGAIWLLDESGQILTIRGAYGLSKAIVNQSRCRVGEGMAGQVVKTGEAWLSNDLPHEPGFYHTAVDEGLLASVGVPLMVGDAVIGVLMIYSKIHGDTFDQEDLYFLRLLTSQAAIAIENARLFEAERQANQEVQRKAERLNVLNRVSTIVSMSLQLDEVLPPLLREMVRILETSLGLLALREDGRDRYRVRTRFGLWQSNLDEVDWQTLPLLKIIERTRSPLLITNAATDERLRPLTALIEQEHIRTALLLPLVAQNEVSGFILLGVINQERAFEAAEVELARTLTNQAAIAVEKARLYEATVTRYEQEQEIARQIQQNLLPRIVPQIPGLRLAGLCRPAYATGGDFYDYVLLPDYRLGIVVSDVSGKSLPAAMVMALARNTIRAELLNHLRPDEAMTAANRWLCQDTQRNTFVATLQVVIDSIRPTLWLVSAGQTAPLLRRQGQITYLSPDEAIGLPLGIVPDLTYHQAEISLYPGDTLLFYTDGLVEAKNKTGELFGFDRLEAALLRLDNGNTPQQVIDHLLAEAQAFVGGADQHDDITMVVVQIE